MDEIALDLIGLHRLEMVAGDDPLAKLLEAFPFRELISELGLAEQENLNQSTALCGEVRKHAKLFERRHGEALGLVDDEERALARPASSISRCSMRSSNCALARPSLARPRPWAVSRSRSSASTWVETRLIAFKRSRSIVASRCATSVDLPAPISPVTTTKPSPWARP
jgi:hypothetical protein